MSMLKIRRLDKLHILSYFFILYCSIYPCVIYRNPWYVKASIVLAILLSFFINFFKKQIIVLLVGMLIIYMYLTFLGKYYIIGNHGFVTIYIGCMLLLAHAFSANGDAVIQKNSLWLLFIIMLFGAGQKLFSPTYLSGDYMNYVFNVGGLFPLLGLNPAIGSYFEENRILAQAFVNTYPTMSGAVRLSLLFEHQTVLIYWFSIFIILVEFLFVFALFWKNEIFKHLFFLVFLIMVAFTRQETGFLSMLCFLCFTQLPKSMPRIFNFSYCFFFLGCLVLMFFKIGYH
jgi:hypothetical protein